MVYLLSHHVTFNGKTYEHYVQEFVLQCTVYCMNMVVTKRGSDEKDSLELKSRYHLPDRSQIKAVHQKQCRSIVARSIYYTVSYFEKGNAKHSEDLPCALHLRRHQTPSIISSASLSALYNTVVVSPA